MDEELLVSTYEFCASHHIESSFINTLNDYGLIRLIIVGEIPFIHSSELSDLETIATLHYELDINIEGIEAIRHLLDRMKLLSDQVNALSNRLKFYEGEMISENEQTQ